jgi:hypothetical protein
VISCKVLPLNSRRSLTASALFEQTRRTLIQRCQAENQGKQPRAPL